jgi:hypothetical protein
MLEAALNGDRDHPALPRTPEELAAEGRAAVDSGALAVRGACPTTPVSLSTSADIEPDPERRMASIAAWTELPELVTANQGEEGAGSASRRACCRSTTHIQELCELLFEHRGSSPPASRRAACGY